MMQAVIATAYARLFPTDQNVVCGKRKEKVKIFDNEYPTVRADHAQSVAGYQGQGNGMRMQQAAGTDSREKPA
jgi:hypothetical protein